MNKNRKAALLGIALLLAASVAQATTETTFQDAGDRLSDWQTGSLGRVFALGALGVGLAIGVVKQSVMSVVTGVAVALSASIGPGVLTGMFTATL